MPSESNPKTMMVMPTYNAAKTIERTYADIPKNIVSQILVVDDLSQDETVEIAKRLGLDVVVHVQNRGYGGNQKLRSVSASPRSPYRRAILKRRLPSTLFAVRFMAFTPSPRCSSTYSTAPAFGLVPASAKPWIRFSARFTASA